MGASASAQAETSQSSPLHGCQQSCCAAGGPTAADGGIRFCDGWSEENAELPRVASGLVKSQHGWVDPALAASRLYEPGALAPFHRLGACSLAVKDVYIMDVEPLGRGSYGEVFAATHRHTNARRAVKSVGKAELQRYVSDVGSFVRREVEILKRLDHPNIVRLYETFEDDTHIHLVLELCDGGDLLEQVAVARERLPEPDVAELLVQVLGALQQIHRRKVVHRDVKPENFLFAQRGEDQALPRSPLKLIDFGLSRRLTVENARFTPKIGTTEYMAPEAYAGTIRAELADRADMWSVGVVLHVIFIGHFPSPRLVEDGAAAYFGASCWHRVSSHGLDLLAQLLRIDVSNRPRVATALRHPWLASATAAEPPPCLVQNLHLATRAFASNAPLRKLALVAAAREAHDADTAQLRRLWRALELRCGGALTRGALERFVSQRSGEEQPLTAVAAELAQSFEDLDLDGSGSLDWTELLAVALGIASSHGLDGSDEDTLPLLKEEASFRAFGLLGQGHAISSQSLQALLSAEAEDQAAGPGWLVGYVSGSTGGSGSGLPVQRCASKYDAMVQEVAPSGSIDLKIFLALLQNRM